MHNKAKTGKYQINIINLSGSKTATPQNYCHKTTNLHRRIRCTGDNIWVLITTSLTNILSVSIAGAIHVPYHPNKFQRAIHVTPERIYEAELILFYVNTNSYPKFDVNILKDERKERKTK